jgi:glucose-6-phosphate dehydrogenase assembly protein OpcA
MSGDLARHPESVVLPLLLPDSPVVVWWPTKPPDDPAGDPIGQLAQRRITDVATVQRGRQQALLQQCSLYADGNTDLAWTRLTPWRALLAAALDQYPARIRSGRVAAEHVNPSADLLAAWLSHRLNVPVERSRSKGPGITTVTLETGGGDISISRPDGRLAQFTLPNGPARPVALKRRETAELLAEELRRLDPDDTYAQSVRELCRVTGVGQASNRRTAKASSRKSNPTSKRATTKTKASRRPAKSGGAAKAGGRGS